MTLHNYSATGSSITKSATTNAFGQAVFSNTSLHFKVVEVIETGNGKPHRDRETLPPTLDVSAAGFSSVSLDLL